MSLLFQTGSEIPGDHLCLEGDAALARVMRFRDEAVVERHQGDLQRIVQAWCTLKAGGATAS